jgi:hypothetical protein
MFFEPPTQTAKEIQLTFFWVSDGIRTGQCVIARPVQMGAIQRDGVGILGQIISVEVLRRSSVWNDSISPTVRVSQNGKNRNSELKL